MLENRSKENRECKNSVFVDLFYENEFATENDIALYNALHDEPLPPGTTVEKIRVGNELYMNFKNDVSFGLGGKLLVLAEHQSTVNENMPLRSLLYIGRAFEQLVPVKDRYRRKKVPLPKPEIYVFYNGREKYVKEKILYLSDSYMINDDEPMLELKVKVININPEQNHEVLEKCPVLRDYSIFIDTIRKYQGQRDDNVYEKAIRECIDKGILVDYLRIHGSEVVNMLMSEYNYEQDIEVQREEAFEEGERLGRQEGEKLGRKEGEKRGQKRFADLATKLIEAGRSEDIIKAAQDPKLCDKLYREYDIE
jgi:hypothetical protein